MCGSPRRSAKDHNVTFDDRARRIMGDKTDDMLRALIQVTARPALTPEAVVVAARSKRGPTIYAMERAGTQISRSRCGWIRENFSRTVSRWEQF